MRCRLRPLAANFKLQSSPAADYGWLVAIVLGYSTLVTLMKRVRIWRYGW